MIDGKFWKDKKVFITGITGFLGESLAWKCRELGAEVFGLSRTSFLTTTGCFKTFTGDICNQDLIRQIISSQEIDVIFHCAANAIVKSSAVDPVSAYQTNVMGTINILEAARVNGSVSSIVVASSDKAYGHHDDLPYMENYDLRPKNTYDTSKACMDMISRTYALNYDMPICVTRSSNIYGPGDRNTSRIIPNTILKILNDKKPILYSEALDMEREFVYIEDVVNAYLLIAEHCRNFKGEAFNIGTNEHTKISDLISLICSKMNWEKGLDIVCKDKRFKEINKQYLLVDKLKRFNWKPSIDLEEGLSKTITWYSKEIKLQNGNS